MLRNKTREQMTAALGTCIIALILIAMLLFVVGVIFYFTGDLPKSQNMFLMTICILLFLHLSYTIRS